MITIHIPVTAVTGQGALSAVTGEFLKMGINALGTNADGIASYKAHLNMFSYNQIFTGSPSLYQSILGLGGSVEFSHEGAEMQFCKAPISYKTRLIPTNYPGSTYIDENEQEQTYTYGEYHFHSGQPPYIKEDEGYIYFTASEYGGVGKVVGLDILALLDDGVELISKEAYISAVPIEQQPV